jgi:GT2 family glycosyltransferase
MLLNPDTQLDPGSLEQLVAILDAEPTVGAVGPVMHQPAGRRKVLEAGRQLTTWRMLMHLSGLSRLSRDHPALEGVYLIRGVHDDRRRDVEWLSGACVLVRSTVFTELGPLSERWFMYAEDFEFSLRMTRANWRLSHVPEARVSHDMSTSSASADRRVAWALAWSDFHRTELASNSATHALWRLTFASMLATRAVRAALKAMTDRAHAREWRFEAQGLATCAVRVISGATGSALPPTPTPAAKTGTGSTRR